MRVEIENDKLDLGTTPIENMFINTYLSAANEIQIKVYLYALSNAHNGNHNISNENIAKEMNLTEGQVVDAWRYWIDLGVVEITESGSYRFKSIRNQYIEAMIPALRDIPQTRVETVKEISDENTKELIENIEGFISEGSIVSKKLNAREIKVLLEMKSELNITSDFLQYAYFMASGVRGQKAVDPIAATIRNWVIDGITNNDQLDKYLLELSNKEKQKSVTNYPKKEKENLFTKDDRMSSQERKDFIEKKINRPLPIKKRDRK